MIINQYARELGILKDKDANFTGLDVRNGMTAVVAVKHPAPRFEGQTKTKLDNPDAGTVVANVTGDEVQLYFDRHLDDLNAVIACAEKSAKIRKAEEKAKTNMLTKQKFSIDSNGKLANCESKNPEECEVFIVELEVQQRLQETEELRQFFQSEVRFLMLKRQVLIRYLPMPRLRQ